MANIEEIALEEREFLEEIRNKEDILEARKKKDGIKYYVPNKMQLKAHQSDARLILFSGGNRSGKSTFGAAELCFHLTKRYPDWFSKVRRFKGPVKAVISSTEFPVIGRVIEPKIKALLPEGFYKVKRNPTGYMSRLLCEDGSVVDFLTLEMADEAYESADWDFFWGDEPQSKRKFDAIQRGLIDRRGIGVITFTPLTEPWMKEDLVDKADGKKIEVFQVRMRDNLQSIDGTPILAEENIKEFEELVSEEYRESRLEGKFFHLRGVIYQEFGEPHLISCGHKINDPTDCPFHYRYPDPVICVLDPHDRTPHHLIWAYLDRQDDLTVDYEYTGHIELDDLAKTILKIEQERGYKVKRRLIDPNFGRKPYKVGTNLSVIQELAKHGAKFQECNDDIELGHMIVRDYLHYDRKKPVTATNKPKLFFNRENCPKTIKSMKNLQYEEWQGKTKGEKNPKEVEKEKDNHGADCIRYLCVTKPRYQSIYREDENAERFY